LEQEQPAEEESLARNEAVLVVAEEAAQEMRELLQERVPEPACRLCLQ